MQMVVNMYLDDAEPAEQDGFFTLYDRIGVVLAANLRVPVKQYRAAANHYKHFEDVGTIQFYVSAAEELIRFKLHAGTDRERLIVISRDRRLTWSRHLGDRPQDGSSWRLVDSWDLESPPGGRRALDEAKRIRERMEREAAEEIWSVDSLQIETPLSALQRDPGGKKNRDEN